MTQKKVVLIGSGIAALATAIRLQNQNFDVHVYECAKQAGGKINEFYQKGYRFDRGPSLFTMPQFIEELFSISGKNIEDYFEYTKKSVVCNYFYEDGTRFTAYGEQQEFANEASKVFDVDATTILKYFANSKKKYDLTNTLFLEQSLHKLSTYLSVDTLRALVNITALDINDTLHEVNCHTYQDEKLVQLFDRFATYNGSSPYHTPGIMSMIPHLEQYFGTFFPKDGIYSVAKSLYQLAKDLGVVFHFETCVDEILVVDKKAVGIQIREERIAADIVVSNMDVVPTYRTLMPRQKPPEKTLKQSRSSSALIFYWGIKKTFPHLDLHNIFFADNYKEEFDFIFEKKDVTDDPTIYVNISAKNKTDDAPEGCENWFVMINVPCNEGQDWEQIIKKSRKNIINKLSRMLEIQLEDLIEVEDILDPVRLENTTKSYQGSLYGASSNNKYAAFLRHPNFSRRIKNLYFCGGSVHPGGGIPLCLLSGKIVSELIEKNRNL